VNRQRGAPVRRALGVKRRTVNEMAVAMVFLEFRKGHGLTLAAAASATSEWFHVRGARRVSASKAKADYLHYFGRGRNAEHVNRVLDEFAFSVAVRVNAWLEQGSSEQAALAAARSDLVASGVVMDARQVQRLWARWQDNQKRATAP
jgi:hypothetical protein